MPWTYLLDILMSALLAITIVFAMVLNRRLAALRRDRIEFEKLVSEFHEAIAGAEDSVARLKISTDALDERNRLAENHEKDLQHLADRAEGAANRLEAAIRKARPDTGPAEPRPQPMAPEGGIVARSEAERQLLQAMRFQR